MAMRRALSPKPAATSSTFTSAVRTFETHNLRTQKFSPYNSGSLGGSPLGGPSFPGGMPPDFRNRLTGGGGGYNPNPFGQTSQPSGGGICDGISNALVRAACRAAERKFLPSEGSGGGGGGGGGGQQNPCPAPMIRNPITGNCIDPTALPPGGRPAFVQAGGQAQAGAFGMPAITPSQEMRTHLSCPTGMVLGKDNLCYPKAVLRRTSRFRKWKPGPRAKITAAEWRTLKRAERVRDEAKQVAQAAGFSVRKK